MRCLLGQALVNGGAFLKPEQSYKWWYLGVPVAMLAGVALAVWLRTSPEDAGVLQRGTRVDLAFTRVLEPPVDAAVLGDRRHFLVMVFGYAHCPDVCPTTLLAVHQLLDRLGPRADLIVPIFVTVDPARDTPSTLRAFADNFDPRIRVISAADAASAAQRAFRAKAVMRTEGGPGEYSVDHTAVLYLLDPDHRVIAAIPEAQPVEKLERAVLTALERSGDFPRS